MASAAATGAAGPPLTLGPPHWRPSHSHPPRASRGQCQAGLGGGECESWAVTCVPPRSLFAQCHPLAPPQHYYEACVFDTCSVPNSGLECASLQTYAALCAHEGVCIDWRNHTHGACRKRPPTCLDGAPAGLGWVLCQPEARLGAAGHAWSAGRGRGGGGPARGWEGGGCRPCSDHWAPAAQLETAWGAEPSRAGGPPPSAGVGGRGWVGWSLWGAQAPPS